MEARVNALWGHFRANRLTFTLVILLTLALGILVGSVVSFGVRGQEKKSAEATQLSVPPLRQVSSQFTQIAKSLEPAVVNINTESTIKPVARRRGENGDDRGDQFGDFFDKFFGGQENSGPVRERSLGSGVLVDPKGFIVTNRHVIEKADRIQVRLQAHPPAGPHVSKLLGRAPKTHHPVVEIAVGLS